MDTDRRLPLQRQQHAHDGLQHARSRQHRPRRQRRKTRLPRHRLAATASSSPIPSHIGKHASSIANSTSNPLKTALDQSAAVPHPTSAGLISEHSASSNWKPRPETRQPRRSAAGSSPAKPTRKPPLPALTGIRTLLAIFIILFHFTPPHLGLLYPFIDNGYVFVGFFFLISGFVLTYNYADRARSPSASASSGSPASPVSIPSISSSSSSPSACCRTSGTLAPTPSSGAESSSLPSSFRAGAPSVATFWNTVAWTLSSEVVLYLAFPWLIRLPWPKTPRRLIALLFALWIIGLIPHSPLSLSSTPTTSSAPSTATAPPSSSASSSTPRSPTSAPFSPASLSASCSTLSPSPRASASSSPPSASPCSDSSSTPLVNRTPYLLMHGGLLTPLFAALVLGLSGPHPISSSSPGVPCSCIGESSYCLYLLHFNVFQPHPHLPRARAPSPRRPRPLALLRHPDPARLSRLPFRRKSRPQSHPPNRFSRKPSRSRPRLLSARNVLASVWNSAAKSPAIAGLSFNREASMV